MVRPMTMIMTVTMIMTMAVRVMPMVGFVGVPPRSRASEVTRPRGLVFIRQARGSAAA